VKLGQRTSAMCQPLNTSHEFRRSDGLGQEIVNVVAKARQDSTSIRQVGEHHDSGVLGRGIRAQASDQTEYVNARQQRVRYDDVGSVIGYEGKQFVGVSGFMDNVALRFEGCAAELAHAPIAIGE